MKLHPTLLIGVLATAAFVSAPAQDKAKTDEPKKAAPKGGFAAAPRSPQVQPDSTVTFRLRAANAKEASVRGEFGNKQMTKDDAGVWSATVGPLAPELYGYSFVVDGLSIADPANPHVKPMRSPTTSILDLPGDPPLLHDFTDVPHGTVRMHAYRSKSLGALRRMHIYTPPGYDHDPAARFPVLYLFHGSGDNDGCWTVLGRAHFILDNLLAQGRAKPMIVVMTDGHAAFSTAAGVAADGVSRNVSAFSSDLLGDVMPFVEANYRTKADRANRALVGLSMGGGQSLGIGLNNVDKFAWVGGMSSFLPNPEQSVAPIFADPKATNEKLKLLWFACGRDDRLVDGAKRLDELLTSKGITHEFKVTDGGHSWPVWRKYLAEFAPRLFADK